MRTPTNRSAAQRPILVVEDSTDDFDTVVTAAENSGVRNRLVHAADADEARELLTDANGEAYALVLLDNNLPGTSGCELLAQLREEPRCRALPFVVYTTSSSTRDRDACYAAGASAYHVKSVRFDRSLETLSAIFDDWVDHASGHTPWRILLVDADPEARAETQAKLLRGSTRRYEVIEANSGAQALRVCRTPPRPDCLVVSDDLPDMHVCELLEALPRAGSEPLVAVVVLTSDEATNRELLRAGAQDFVGKDWMTAGSLTRGVERAIERLRAARELRANQQLNRSLMEGLLDCVMVLDPDGRLVHANTTALRVLEFDTPRALRGRVWWSLWDEPHRTQLREAVERAKAQAAVVTVQTPFPTPETWWDVTISPVRDEPTGPVVHLLLISRDITSQRQYERALVESEQRLRLAVRAAALGIFERDLSQDVVHLDSRAQAILGIHEASTAPCTFLDRIHREDLDLVHARIAAALQGNDGGAVCECRVIHPDGSVHWIATHVFVEFEPRGPNPQPLRFIGTLEDITARKQAETDLRESEERLREADRCKDEFLAMLGHELRNPLAAIRSAAELLQLTVPDHPQLNAVHAVLERQSCHMTRLIDSLLEVSRIARGKIVLDRKTVDLREVIQSVLADSKRVIDGAGLELHVACVDQPLWVWADPVRLVQVFDNLLGNAVKFTDPPGTITVIVTVEDAHAVVRVRDTGVGVRPDLLPHIFDPFRQETQDIARSAGGLGLGLALVRGLVKLHQGSVGVHSEGLGKGTEFSVRLPLTGVAPCAEPDEQEPAARGQHVLIVEDNPDAASMLQGILQLRGYAVTVAHTGAEALELLREQAMDVVLCDLGLPDVSGYDVAQVIREDPALRELGLVALTGYGQTEDRERSREAGFDAHLTKPVDLCALERVLEQFG